MLSDRFGNALHAGFRRHSRWFSMLILFFMFAAGLAIRLYDLTDPPLDFHPTRQLHSAIIARGFYYRFLPSAPEWQRQKAMEQLASHRWIEPPIFEGLVALTYRLIGSEQLWVARLYAILFWLVGGVALYRLAGEMTSPKGAVIALAYYLFLPFGIIGSRSFQPDPLMVMFLVWSLWLLYRWYRNPTWRSALSAGLCMGMTLLVKAVGLFPLLVVVGFLSLVGKGLRNALRDAQVWTILGLGLTPMVIYHIYGVYISGALASQFEGRFFPEMWLEPAFYVRWVDSATHVAGFGAILAGLLGVWLYAQREQRALVAGLWVGYLLYGLAFPYHITTHSYYHLWLIPLVALSSASLADLAMARLFSVYPRNISRLLLLGLLSFGILVEVWGVRVDLARQDYRQEPTYWQEMASQMGREASVIALTHDYGDRLAYYGWITPQVWLPTGHLEGYRELRGGAPINVRELFAEMTQGKDFFLITLLNQFDAQPELKRLLYENYAIYAEGDGYIIFDLHKPLK